MTAVARPYADGRAATWGLHATNVVQSPSSLWSGRGIRIAILDTGVDLTHRDLGVRVAGTRSFASGCLVQDDIGHGTHCAGIAAGLEDPRHRRYGIACNADLYVGRVFDGHCGTTIADVLAGMDWALSNGCHVISMSLGTFDAFPVAEFEAAGRRALDAGCLVVAAAGNNRSRVVVQPANAESILAVGAIDNRLEVAAFSAGSTVRCNGAPVDLMAPGVDVYSTAPRGTYASRDGTSMAAAHVAGIAALWAEAEGLRGWALWQRLVGSARPLPPASGDHLAPLVSAP
jgi:subtilisin family serine protease